MSYPLGISYSLPSNVIVSLSSKTVFGRISLKAVLDPKLHTFSQSSIVYKVEIFFIVFKIRCSENGNNMALVISRRIFRANVCLSQKIDRIHLSPPEKDLNFDKKLRSFSTKSVLRRNKSASQMKSLRDEILLCKEIRRI